MGDPKALAQLKTPKLWQNHTCKGRPGRNDNKHFPNNPMGPGLQVYTKVVRGKNRQCRFSAHVRRGQESETDAVCGWLTLAAESVRRGLAANWGPDFQPSRALTALWREDSQLPSWGPTLPSTKSRGHTPYCCPEHISEGGIAPLGSKYIKNNL